MGERKEADYRLTVMGSVSNLTLKKRPFGMVERVDSACVLRCSSTHQAQGRDYFAFSVYLFIHLFIFI